MANSRVTRGPFVTELERALSAYLDGRQTVADFLAWEAEYSLDEARTGALRTLLDRLSVVAAEVCDGVRDEGEFRALAREAIAAGLADARVVVAEASARYRTGSDPN